MTKPGLCVVSHLIEVACRAASPTQKGSKHMCVSLAPATFSNTIVAAWEISEKLHALGYQNKAQHLALGASGGNAMILPIPAVPRTLTRKNLLDTTSCKNILDDMAEALNGRCRSMCVSGVGEEAPSVDIFDFDVYTVVLAQNAEDIPAALSRVPEDKRPALNSAVFNAYATWYPKWPVALCCFRNDDIRRLA